MYFNDNLSSIIVKYKDKYRGNLEEYLIGVYRELEELEEYLKESEKEVQVSNELFLEILEQGFLGERYCTCSKGFEKEPVKDHYPKCKYIGYCGTICDCIEDEKEEKKYKKTKLKKGEYGLYKVKRSLEEFIDNTRDVRNDEKQDPFIFLENIILCNNEYNCERSSDNKYMRGHHKTQITEWTDFIDMLQSGWNFKRVKEGYHFGIYKMIPYVIGAIIVIPQIINDKLTSPIKSIKYFSIIALLYLIFCYAARFLEVRLSVDRKKVSDNFKIGKVELIVHLIIIVTGFML